MMSVGSNKNFIRGYHVLRVGLGITFLWIGILILKSPDTWGGYLQPWAVRLLPISIAQALISTALFDIIVGFLLLVDWWPWLAGLMGAVHLVIVLTVSGITDITIRDIGLLAGCITIMIESLPPALSNKISALYKKRSADKN